VSIKCLACGSDSADTAKFCSDCGALLMKACPNCDQRNQPHAKFCSGCGSQLAGTPKITAEKDNQQDILRSNDQTRTSLKISSEGERRHATILRADLTGYTALTERLGPEVVEDILEKIKPIATKVITGRGGLINQFRGDEIIALFGAALSENDARDAVQAALDLHERIKGLGTELGATISKSLTMHSGVCTGLVVIRPSANRDGVFSISGDAINTAARLANLAEPDELLVAPATRQLIEPFFKLERLAPLELKGKIGEITPYRVLGAYTERSQFEGRIWHGVAGFAGRMLELAHLNQLLGRARNGQGQFVVISAHAGFGKSRLAYEFLKSIPRAEIAIATTTCSPVTADTPYFPWTDVARQLLDIDLTLDIDARVAKIQAACMKLELDAERFVPMLCQLLTPAQRDSAAQVIEQGPARRQIIFQTLFSLIRRAASVRPLVIVLEDWQWADQASDDFLRNHLEQISSLPVLIVLTFRASAQISWPIQEHITALSLGPLAKVATAEMVASMFSATGAPEWFVTMVQERTGGNPLFIEEILRSLKSAGLIGVKDGELSIVQPIPTFGIPDTVQRAVLQRLDRLEPSWRETLRRASVIGREFSLPILARLVAADTDLNSVMLELQTLGFLMQVRDEPQSVFAFKHVVIQNVAYETLLFKHRKDLHGRVAQAIEEQAGDLAEEHCEALAYHYSRDHDLDRAVRYLEQAGDRAARNFALESARNHYAAAIHLLSEFEQTNEWQRLRIEISLKWAAASQFAASKEQLDVMRSSLDSAIALGDLRLKALCHYWLGRMHYGLGDPNRGVPEFETVLASAAHLNDQRLVGRTYCVLGRSSLFTAEPARGINFLESGIPILQQLGDLGEVAYSISSHACIRTFIGEFGKAEDLFAQARQLARENLDRTNEALVLQQLSYSRCLRGNWESAIEAAAACLEIAHISGLPVLTAFAQIFRAYARWMLGDHREGYREMIQAIQVYQSTGYRMAGSLCHGWCAEICALHGDFDRARVHAELSIAQEARGDRFGQLPARRALAEIALRTHQPTEVKSLIATALGLAESRKALPDLGIGHFSASETFRELGELDTSMSHRKKAREIFAALDMPWWLARTA
jgi:class 3 adenylate cyclase/tetratricopeptide (TPR) repeat protein